jgi:hypothetical protein
MEKKKAFPAFGPNATPSAHSFSPRWPAQPHAVKPPQLVRRFSHRQVCQLCQVDLHCIVTNLSSFRVHTV